MKQCYQWVKKPWFWVLLGAIMTASSAFVSHHILMENNHRIESLRLQSGQIDQRIESYWANENRLERDSNIAMLMSLTATTNPALPASTQEDIKDYIKQLVKREGDDKQVMMMNNLLADTSKYPASLLPVLLGFVNETRQQTVNAIDGAYLEKLSLQEQIEHLEMQNASYSGIALFLQIMGLIMVLSKDLARRTWPS